MPRFFSSNNAQEESKEPILEQHSMYVLLEPETEVDKLEKIKLKIENQRSSFCRKLYRGQSIWHNPITDGLVTAGVAGSVVGLKDLIIMAVSLHRAENEAQWHYQHDIRLNNKTCSSLLSQYMSYEDWCHGGITGPTNFLLACRGLIVCDDGGLGVAALVVAFILLGIIFGFSFFRYLQYRAPLSPSLSRADVQTLNDNQISVHSRMSRDFLIQLIDAKVLKLKTNLTVDVLRLVDSYLEPDHRDAPAHRYISYMS